MAGHGGRREGSGRKSLFKDPVTLDVKIERVVCEQIAALVARDPQFDSRSDFVRWAVTTMLHVLDPLDPKVMVQTPEWTELFTLLLALQHATRLVDERLQVLEEAGSGLTSDEEDDPVARAAALPLGTALIHHALTRLKIEKLDVLAQLSREYGGYGELPK